MPFKNPPRWTREQLQEARDVAEKRFVAERTGEGPSAYYAQLDRVEPLVDAAFSSTNNLLDVSKDLLSAEPQLWQTLRYFCAPPISEEDLWTLVGRKFKQVKPEFAPEAASAFAALLDTRRFPWLVERRQPTAFEAQVGRQTSAMILAHESLKTSRRGTASRAQEDEVVDALQRAGLKLDSSRKRIDVLDGLARNSFSRERKVDGAKCDVPVRLADGRLLALECKVSNGPKNSWKRLHRETGGKAERWRQEFGSQALTGAVLAGVYDLKCLESAQEEQGVFLFWQHDLSPLLAFVVEE